MNNLIKIREFFQLTQNDISNLIGVNRSTYSDYERKRVSIPIEKLNIIANTYRLSLDYLLDLTDNYKNKITPKDTNKKEIGKILKNLREKSSLNQLELADKINTHQSKISNYEKGKGITIKVLQKYALFFNKSVDYLCGKTK